MKTKLIKIIILAISLNGICFSAFSQAVNKPSIMIFPDDVWLKTNNCSTEVDNQGVKVDIPNY